MSEYEERIRDQIHGFIHLTSDEMKIIDTRPFQRLRRIHQLAFTHFVYPGAEHTRFAHSLGVMEVATQVFDHMWARSRPYDEAMKAHLRQVLRLYALLHDVGHGPFSHAGDDLFPEGLDHEEYSRRIIIQSEVGEIIDHIGSNLAAQYGPDYRITPELIGQVIVGGNLEPPYHLLRQIMSSEADADKMDYLLRDSTNCGVAYGLYDLQRLLNSFLAHPVARGDTPKFRLGIEFGGLHAFEAFILARYWMFLQVYFHRTRRIYDFFLHKFLKEFLPNGRFPENLDDFLALDDYSVWMEIGKRQDENSWARGIVKRDTWSSVFESPSHAEAADSVEFRYIERELRKLFPEEQWYVDRASKAPHKLPATSDLEDPKVVVLVRNGQILDLNRESEIVRKIVSPITKYRVYAAPAIAKKVKEVCDELHDELHRAGRER